MKEAAIYMTDGIGSSKVDDFKFTKVTDLHKRLREFQKPYFQDDEIGTIAEDQTASGTPSCECWSNYTNYSHIAFISNFKP
jgi:hypothetical protein